MVGPRSASSSTMAADLPPSSRLTRFSCSPHTLPDRPAGGRRAGEGHLVDAGMGDQVRTDLAAGGDDVHDARGDAGLLQQLGEQVRVERRLRRRLHHDGAAGQQGRDELGHDRELGDVPRRDRRHDAHRLVPDDHVGAQRAGSRLLPRELAGHGEERLDLHPRSRRLRQVRERRRRAHLDGDQVGHLAEARGVEGRRTPRRRRSARPATSVATARRRTPSARRRRRRRCRPRCPRAPWRPPPRCAGRSPAAGRPRRARPTRRR